MNIEKLSNLFGADLVKAVYQDGLSEPLKETSSIAVDIIKAARLFTAPIQLLASYQDRLQRHFQTVINRVPEERQIPCIPNLAGKIMEELKYLPDANILTELYLNLLTRGIDKDRVAEAHPAFLIIIQQLSTDEARILYSLRNRSYTFNQYVTCGKYNLDETLNNNKTLLEGLYFPHQITFYLNHLKSLNLIISNAILANNNRIELSITHFDLIKTDFGEAFIKAVIPEDLSMLSDGNI